MPRSSFGPCKEWGEWNIWFCPATKANGTEYYQYILLYLDDILVVMENPEYFIRNNLCHRFVIKPSSIGPHMQFLGNKVYLVTLANHPQSCSFIYSQYVQNAVKNVSGKLACKGRSLPKRALSPWTIIYRPETIIAPELSPILASYYQSLIGILR